MSFFAGTSFVSSSKLMEQARDEQAIQQEMKVVSYAWVTFNFNSRKMAGNFWLGWQSEA